MGTYEAGARSRPRSGRRSSARSPAVWGLGVVVILLVVMALEIVAVSGAKSVSDRFDATNADARTVAQLACLGDAVEALTRPGDELRLEASDDFLAQRITEITYPRIVLVDRPGAPVLTVGPLAAVPEGRACRDLAVAVLPGDR